MNLKQEHAFPANTQHDHDPEPSVIRVDFRQPLADATESDVLGRGDGNVPAAVADLGTLLDSRVFDFTSVVACIGQWADEEKAIAAELAGATSRTHKALYRMIGRGPYDYCVRAAAQDEEKQRLMDGALNAVLKQRGVKSKKSSARSIRAVKAMFGAENRSIVSSYAKLIDAGIAASISVVNFPEWLNSEGGMEAVRNGKKRIDAATRLLVIEKHEKALRTHVVATLAVSDADKNLFQDFADVQVALLVTYSVGGEFKLHGVVPHDSHILAGVRAACFHAQKEDLSLEPLPPVCAPVKLATKGA